MRVSFIANKALILTAIIFLTLSASPPSEIPAFHNHRITVWVHGTYLVSNTRFKKYFDSKEQLKQSAHLEVSRYFKTTIEGLIHYHPDLESLYIFGWSGSLSNHERQKAAWALYRALKDLSQQYEQTHKQKPTLHVISHSHGGNVILHMAHYHTHDSPLEIDTVILLACPAQKRMHAALQSPLFKQIYSFYSYADFIQILAPNLLNTHSFSWKGLRWYPFSHRRFPDAPALKQAAISINGKEPGHNTFRKKKFLEHLPYAIDALKNNRSIDYEKDCLALHTIKKSHPRA
jgi:hypothetical protein